MTTTDRVPEIRRTRRAFAQMLTAWSVGSVLIGLPLWFGGLPGFYAAVGSQFAIWGAIDLVFAVLGLRQAAEAEAGRQDDEVEAGKLLNSLRFSHKLNYVWVGAGVALAVWAALASNSPVLWGHAVGVLVQGGFLFGFDWRFGRALRQAMDRAD